MQRSQLLHGQPELAISRRLDAAQAPYKHSTHGVPLCPRRRNSQDESSGIPVRRIPYPVSVTRDARATYATVRHVSEPSRGASI